ncbi:MAG: prolyl oligopeptidase family serine peptidase, partial [Pseudomonadota bacterium]
MQTKTITYYSDGDIVVGDLHLPDDFSEEKQYPAVLQCQGFTGIRKMVQPVFAEYFVNAGFVSLAIDYRGWGDSGGERGRMAPLEQVEDCRNGFSWLEAQPFVDSSRMAQFGASFGALITPYTMALDHRVQAGVATGGVAHGLEAITNQRTPEQMAEWLEKTYEARQKRVLTNEVDRSLNVMDIFIDPESRSWEPEMWEAVPAWRNWFGFDSLARCVDFRPIDVVHRVTKPIAYMLAEKDIVADTDSFR